MGVCVSPRHRLKPAATMPSLLQQAEALGSLLQQAWRLSVGIHPHLTEPTGNTPQLCSAPSEPLLCYNNVLPRFHTCIRASRDHAKEHMHVHTLHTTAAHALGRPLADEQLRAGLPRYPSERAD